MFSIYSGKILPPYKILYSEGCIKEITPILRQAFRNDILIQQWNCNSNNVLYNDFINKIDNCVNMHAPMKKLNLNDLKLKSKPWISRYLAKLIEHRNKLFRKKGAIRNRVVEK